MSDHAGSFIRHSRAGGSPVELAGVIRMPLDSRLRGNDEMRRRVKTLSFHVFICVHLCVSVVKKCLEHADAAIAPSDQGNPCRRSDTALVGVST